MVLYCTTDQQTAKAHKDMLQKQGRGRRPASKHERKQCFNDHILKIFCWLLSSEDPIAI